MSSVPLEEVTEVFGGYRPPSKPAALTTSQREERLLEPSSVAEGKPIPWTSLQTVDLDAPAKFLLRNEDVLVQLRGANLITTLSEQPPVPVVASHRFAIVRPDTQVLLPGYLSAVLRHPQTQARIQASSRRSTARFVSLAELRKLLIYIPPLPVQQKIARADRLRLRYERLRRQHEDLVNQVVDAAISNAMRTQ